MHRLTLAEATALNKRLRADGVKARQWYKPGDEYDGFPSRASAVAYANRGWHGYFPDACFLVLGEPVHTPPLLILDSSLTPEKHKQLVEHVRALVAVARIPTLNNATLADLETIWWQLLEIGLSNNDPS